MRLAVAALLSLCLMAPSSASVQAASQSEQRLQMLAERFYAYSLPLAEVVRRREAFLARQPANIWRHVRTLADHEARTITTPNNDTLYSHAFLDLRGGPVTIRVPASGSRYLSVALMDMFSNNFAYLGTRATGRGAASLTLVGPGQRAPANAGRVVRAPGPFVWALARTLVAGSQDLAAAHAVQDGLELRGSPSGRPRAAAPARDATTPAYLDAIRALLAENLPLPADAPVIAQFVHAGLLGTRPLPDRSLSAVAQGLATARDRLARAKRPGKIVNGWIYPQANHGDFGTDYDYRAAVAVTGLAAMGQREATYLRSAPDTPHNLFDGKRRYRLHFGAGELPPVDAFWSLSMYERTADGGYYFVANPLRRYAIGDRTPGLTRNRDGSLDIWIGHGDPGPARRSNWLPAPDGPFALSLRAYLPQPALLNGTWRAPAVQNVAQ